jgi:16S rRNA (cytosine967-C5)-methyltransferase
MNKAQHLAVAAIGRVLAGANLTLVLQEIWRSNPLLSHQQRGAIQDLTYGVLRYYGQLDALLSLLLDKTLQDLKLRYLLLVSLYQLQYSKAPSYAIVDHAVSTARLLSNKRGAPGLVNAVLRNFIRKGTTLWELVNKDDVGKYSHPQWWIDKLRKQYPQHYEAILNASNQHPSMTLRVNSRKIGVEAYQKILDEHGIKANLIWNVALKLIQPVAVEKLPGFIEGLVSIQDAGAQLAASLLDVHDGMHVLDACAAPGGKSTHLMESAQIRLTSLDSDAQRLARVAENFERLGNEPDRLVYGNALYPSEWWNGQLFDRILADAPCSASGVVSRHPDIKWLRRYTDLPAFADTQEKILNALWQILKRGGKLLYVTCSVFHEENWLLINKFQQLHQDARLLPLSHPAMTNGQLLPSFLHDGFFYALLCKA